MSDKTKCTESDCEFMIPAHWRMEPHDNFVVWKDEDHKVRHRHNFGFSSVPGSKQSTADKPTVDGLLSEYFENPAEAPTSARILAEKGAKGDIAALRELHRRFGRGSEGGNIQNSHMPVQVQMLDDEGGFLNEKKTATHADERPILNITASILTETWEGEDETPY